MSDYECKVCGKTFKNERGLHCHIKEHNLYVAEYYTKYHPRRSLLNQTPIPFKKGMKPQEYFNQDFIDKREMKKWLQQADQEGAREYILKAFSQRIESKNLSLLPSHLEVEINKLPPIDYCLKSFGSYSELAKRLSVEPMFTKRLPVDFWNIKPDVKIFIDTREQQPLSFRKQEMMKLDFGDYTAAGDHYSYTYIDRKSANDFIGTLSLKNLDRFKREISRAKDADSYIFIVIESDLQGLESYIRAAKRNKFGPSKTNLSFIYHNMREIAHQFKGVCQFVFTGSRESSEDIIERVLYFGEKMWDVDLQYYLDNHELGRG
tara:strand:+ start:3683 stop:4639 length:957 start_codon:yes stop_codon:yes gene_type:complete